ncbi:hypothetical protein HOT82_gp080 [Gordonia phage Ronaldo]|uniref:Uncharacterized protein n=4 Tax=Ronaldovirus TaxID=2733205 RepID=A0A6B9L8L0_9CAUD|nr:hypothetical protein HOT81_gp076 [Gordonia phage Fryberger]YP_009807776.1 hypothetical protein HOT82_gp080 [Gordonia phage Ronaldo]QDH48490.1 hypothetical protein SEA_ZIKO_80 [Gordonia phage Ziko]QHB38196.1 hypothetical protein SEA_VOLT_80 [Gordonia phage Volt]AXN53561.1 hypothetical protein SEA_FRYBERGER_76 [Gordonia phage Fryberger]AXN53642.1 hypothetical protein SEA_RONALDO_80 [Gordonia phage Ronaldo]
MCPNKIPDSVGLLALKVLVPLQFSMFALPSAEVPSSAGYTHTTTRNHYAL